MKAFVKSIINGKEDKKWYSTLESYEFSSIWELKQFLDEERIGIINANEIIAREDELGFYENEYVLSKSPIENIKFKYKLSYGEE